MRFKLLRPTMMRDNPVFDWFIDQYAWYYVHTYRQNHYCQDQHWSQLIEFQIEEVVKRVGYEI